MLKHLAAQRLTQANVANTSKNEKTDLKPVKPLGAKLNRVQDSQSPRD